jgi:hypothetical protein
MKFRYQISGNIETHGWSRVFHDEGLGSISSTEEYPQYHVKFQGKVYSFYGKTFDEISKAVNEIFLTSIRKMKLSQI